MAVDLDPAVQQHEEGEDEEAHVAEEDAPAHHPDAPPDEVNQHSSGAPSPDLFALL